VHNTCASFGTGFPTVLSERSVDLVDVRVGPSRWFLTPSRTLDVAQITGLLAHHHFDDQTDDLTDVLALVGEVRIAPSRQRMLRLLRLQDDDEGKPLIG